MLFYSEFNECFIKDWSKKRKIGVVAFSLLYGSLFFGGILFSGTAILRLIIDNFYVAEEGWNIYIVLFSLYFIGGFFLGAISWRRNEKAYIKLKH